MIRSRLVQELRHGLIWRLAEADNPARPALEGFVRRMEAAVPEGESWLRLENVPVWEPQEAMTWMVGARPYCAQWAPATAPKERQDWIAAGCADGTVRLWNARTRATKTFEGHSLGINSVAFSPDARWLASGSLDHTVRLWDLDRSGSVSIVFEGHSEPISSVTFSPDGRRLASGSYDGTVRLWEREGGRSVERSFGPSFLDESNSVTFVVFSPDGLRLAIGSLDGIRLWDLGDAGPTDLGSPVRLPSDWILSLDLDDEADRDEFTESDKDELTEFYFGDTTPIPIVTSAAFNLDGRLISNWMVPRMAVLWSPERGRNVFSVFEPRSRDDFFFSVPQP